MAQKPHKLYGINDVYTLSQDPLAKTQFSRVVLAEGERTGVKLIKCIEDVECPDDLSTYIRELTALGILELNLPRGSRWPALSRLRDCYDADLGTTPFLVLDYEPGEDFSHRLARGTCSLAELKAIYGQFLPGLQRAHELGIVHRDIKPTNIRLTLDGAKVIDFGLAFHASNAEMETLFEDEGIAFGTVEYIAPEQINGYVDEISPAMDVYALGILAYEALVGCVPFPNANSVRATLFRHLYDPMPNPRSAKPEISTELADVILQATLKNPKERFRDAGEFYAALMDAQTEPSACITVPVRIS